MKNASKSDSGYYTITVTATFINNSLDGCDSTASLTGTANLTYDKCLDTVITNNDWVNRTNFTYSLTVSVMTTNYTCGYTHLTKFWSTCPKLVSWAYPYLTFTN